MSPTEVISFSRGAPSVDIIDVEGLKAAAQRAFERDPAGTTAYGTAVGYQPLRSWIADRHGVAPEQVLVTNGSMQADAFLFETVVKPGDVVIVEAPTYDRTLLNLRKRGADVRAIPLEHDGIDVDALERELRGGLRPVLAHIIPNFQNPAGYTLSAAKRAKLLALAAEFDFLIFEDDPYVEVRFRGTPLPSLLSQDNSDRVIYASSFSKTICPGIRCGYLVGPAAKLAEIRDLATTTYISPNMVAESIVYEYVSSGQMAKSVENVQLALLERSTLLADALRNELPEAKFEQPDGGYFMWVEFPDTVDVAKVFEAAKERGVAFVKGADFLLEGGQHSMRLAYSGVTADQVAEGVRRLADAVRSVS